MAYFRIPPTPQNRQPVNPHPKAAGGRPIYPFVRLAAALALMTIGAAPMYGSIMILGPLAQEFGVSRGLASLPYMLFMIGFGLGGVAIGRLTDRLGIMLPALLSAFVLSGGLVLAARAGGVWEVAVWFGLLAGIGASATFGPLVADISHWFVRRRGLAMAIAISGSYVAGAIWPPVMQNLIDSDGWRVALGDIGLFALVAMLPLAMLLYRRPPELASGELAGEALAERPLGFSRLTLQGLICCAGIGCCAAMSMPQVHIVPYVGDLDIAAARGAEMLALMLGFGVISRLGSGWISDRIGGLRTLLLGSVAQCLVLAAFMLAEELTTFYALSIAFGLAQGGIVPSYAMIVRRYFPAGEAGWRISLALLFTVIGMALGGWMAGALYDLTDSYTISFLNAIGFNLMNMAIAVLLLRRRGRGPGLSPAAA